MSDNRCVRVYDLKQKIKYHPDIGTYITEEDIDLTERILVGIDLDSKSIIRPCGSSWEYCDGICNGCSKYKTKDSNRTDL